MITEIRAQNFKSWQDTGPVRLEALTGLFGANSSGKTAILQFLLLLKQTVESYDRTQVLNMGNEHSYVDLGTFPDIVHGHKLPGEVSFSLDFQLPEGTLIFFPHEVLKSTYPFKDLHFETSVKDDKSNLILKEFKYKLSSKKASYSFGLRRKNIASPKIDSDYEFFFEGTSFNKRDLLNRKVELSPVKSYGFPDNIATQYEEVGFLSDLVVTLEFLFQNIYYLGPLREYPHRTYVWGGEKPQDVGRNGEQAVAALLSSRVRKKNGLGEGQIGQTVEERVAYWLRELGLIYDFKLQPIAENRREYEIKVRRSVDAPEVLISEVGFGISQILPVLVLCYYVPEGATILFEQPEIHLHPSVQAGLADVFIDAIKTRNVQIILESHSEHLLRRLQRRIAEEQISSDKAALYFCQTDDKGASHMLPLELDRYGNINNWPEGFFGDELGELVAMTEAAMQRKQGA